MLAEFIKKLFVYIIGLARNQPKFKIDEHIYKFLAVHQLDRSNSFTQRFFSSIRREGAGGDKDAFIRPSGHCPAQISNLGNCHRCTGLITLALENNLHTQERVDLQEALAINSSITAPTCNLDLLEASFAQQSLAQFFKPIWWQLANKVKNLITIVSRNAVQTRSGSSYFLFCRFPTTGGSMCLKSTMHLVKNFNSFCMSKIAVDPFFGETPDSPLG